MSTPLATWLVAWAAFPASAATSMPRWCAASITSAGGEPSALAISRAGWPRATSTCWRATECSQPSTPSPAWASSWLPGRAPADGVDQPDAARHLVAGDLAPDVLLDRRQVGGPALAHLDQRRDPLPEQLVGNPDDQRVEHVRAGLQRAFDLFGKDLLP